LIQGTLACLDEFQDNLLQENMYSAGFALGKALHYLQDSYTPSHTQRNKQTGLIEAFYDYSRQSPTLHVKDDRATWMSSPYRTSVAKSRDMTRVFFSGNPAGIRGFYDMATNPDSGIPGERYAPRSGAINPIRQIRVNINNIRKQNTP